MRVIQKGNIEELQCECPHCKSIIGYYPYEVKTTHFDMYDKAGISVPENKIGIIINKAIKCPVCGKEIELDWKFY